MGKQKFKTKQELIQELGLSKATFYRLLEKKNIQTTGEMLNPRTESELRVGLGFSPLPGYESPTGQIETNRDELRQQK